MTIKDKYLQKQQAKQEERKQSQHEYVKELGEKLNKALLDPKFIQKATPLLEKHGRVRFSDVGCLCQGGFCEKQKGFTKYCQEAIDYWKSEGVDVKFSITSGLMVLGVGGYFERYTEPSTTLWSND